MSWWRVLVGVGAYGWSLEAGGHLADRRFQLLHWSRLVLLRVLLGRRSLRACRRRPVDGEKKQRVRTTDSSLPERLQRGEKENRYRLRFV